MPLDPAFVDDCPYAPEALLLDEIIEIDRVQSRVVARMAVHAELPITAHQKVHPTRHPRHMNGGLMVHMTGMLGFVHAYYVLELRHREGWIGYGAKIHHARFCALATPGVPLTLAGWAIRSRRIKNSHLVRYRFEFHQGENLVYEGEHTAMWLKVQEGEPLPPVGL